MKRDSKIDALYQLPLEQFTEKRNALAKELSGAPRKQIKFLTKPPLPIWAVNQLYWKDRPAYNALVDASEKLRAAHKAALAGHKADTRKAEQVHRAALEQAVVTTIRLLESRGPVSDVARATVREALAALPNDEQPGRMTRTPEAAGFSLLTGIKPSVVERDSSRAESVAAKRAAAAAQSRERHTKRAREEALATAERDLQRARKAAEQAKFKVRKLSSDLERARATEEDMAGQVAIAEQKLEKLREK